MSEVLTAGAEFSVNTNTAFNQTAPEIAALPDGGYVIVWGTLDAAQDGNSSAIKAQRFDADGNRVGPEFLVNSAALGSQFTPDIATFPDGSFVISWTTNDPAQDGNGGAVKARLFDASGNPVGPEFLVNSQTMSSQDTPSVTVLEDGNFVVSWADWNGFDTKAQIFSSDGQKVGGEFRVNVSTSGFEDSGDIVALEGGGFVVTWRTTNTAADGSGYAVMARVFDSSGVGGAEFVVNSAKSSDQFMASVTALANGGFVVAWHTLDTTQDGSSGAVKAQMFDASGARVGVEFLVNSQTTNIQQAPVVTALQDGGFVVVWETIDSAQDGSGMAVKGQYFDSSGQRVGTEFLVNSLTSGAQFLPSVATLADGSVLVAWASESGDGNGYAIRARTFDMTFDMTFGPEIVSNGGGDTASITVAEGETAVTSVVATDTDSPALTYSITGGDDAALFTIDAATGALSFVTAPDHEVAGDADGDNVYNVTVAASDGTLTDTQMLSVSVADVTEAAPLEFLTTEYDSYENHNTIIMFDVAGGNGSIAYSIVGGADAALFSINHGHATLNLGVQNFEAPADADGDGLYEVQVRAVSGGETVDATIVVAVGNTNDGEGPFFLTEPEWTVDEGEDSVGFVQAPSDYQGSVTYSVIGGPDAGSLVIDAVTGELSFLDTPDFEAPADSDGDNVYEVLVAADSYETAYAGTTATQWVTVTVADVDPEENPAGFAQTAFEVPEILTFSAALEVTGAEVLDLWVVGGEDGWLFDIDTYTGELMMVFGAFDFESPYDYDGDNVYEVEVEAWTGYEYITSTISVTVRDAVNEELFFVTDGTWAATGGEAFVGTVTAFDAQYDALTYTIAGGADAALFTLDAYSGELSFLTAPDFEFPGDDGGDNVYDIELAVSDGQTTEYQTVTVTVGEPEPEAPSPFVQAEFAVDEHTDLSVRLELIDPDPAYTAFWITGGADSDRFFIESGTGELHFSGDFEAWADADGDNVYEVEVTAVGGGDEVTGTVRVTLQDVDEAPDVMPWPISINENSLNGGWVYAWDPEYQPLTYAIVGGADGGLFTINSNTGFVRFTSAADFEAPADAGGNNVYDLIVEVSDGSLSTTQALTVTVQNVGEAPVITSNGGGASASLTVNENATAVTTVAASDPESGVTYSLVAGGDAALFAINASTGALTFVAAPDYEAPTDGGAANVYNVTVRASDGSHTDTQALAITVANLNETPVIGSNGGGATATLAVDENGTAVTTVAADDPELAALVYSITGGADAALFAIDSATGALSFVSAPDHEAPADANGDNVYDVVVTASDGQLSDSQAVSVTVSNVNEAPVLSGGTTLSLTHAENAAAVTTISATDVDGPSITYAIAGGSDAGLFAIDANTGVLAFISSPDFEAPADFGEDNFYTLTVSASDGTNIVEQRVEIVVTNENEGVVITSAGGEDSASLTVSENSQAVTTVAATDIDGDEVAYAIVGGADADRFIIDAATGAIAFITSPDFEDAADADQDNIYEVIVEASDGSLNDRQTLNISVTDVNEGPEITSSGGGSTATVSVAENGSSVAVVTASDAEGQSLTYSISGGEDAGHFSIDPTTGSLSFVAAPNYEAPADAGSDNVYDVQVTVSDGLLADTQSLAVSVANVVDGVTLTGSNSSNSLTGTAAEDTLRGLGGSDTLNGAGGADVIEGGNGNDTLIGGAGSDLLVGGDGADRFVFNSTGDSRVGVADVISDFSRASKDRISVTGMDANANAAGDQNFTFIGNGAFSGTAGQLRYEQSAGDTFVMGDVDGDGVADFVIQVSGVVNFGSGDFLL